MYIESKNKKLKCNQIDIKVIFQRNAKNKVAVLLLSTCKAILSLIEFLSSICTSWSQTSLCVSVLCVSFTMATGQE